MMNTFNKEIILFPDINCYPFENTKKAPMFHLARPGYYQSGRISTSVSRCHVSMTFDGSSHFFFVVFLKLI